MPPPSSVSPEPDRPFLASGIELSFNPEDTCLYAQLIPEHPVDSWSQESLMAYLLESGYGQLWCSEGVVQPVVKAANEGQSGCFVVAEQRDACLHWRVMENKQAVLLTATRAWGGRPLTREWLSEELRQLGVPDTCVIDVAIDEVLVIGQAGELCIARAVMPRHGEDTRFEPLVEESRTVIPQEDELGRVDLHKVREFIIIEPGTPLMRRIPATEGAPGVDVTGQQIPAKAGKDVPFDQVIDGVSLSASDPNLLVASIRGHPVVMARSVKIDPTLHVDSVDLHTGDIDFDGSVVIAGDITSGFVVRATGDVLVGGMVDKAEAHAGRDLIVQGGITGEEHQPAQVSAGGSLSAKFMSLAEASARGDINVREYALQCQLTAGGTLLFGVDGGKGCLIGGRASAQAEIVANVLGSDAYVATEVVLGSPHRQHRRIQQLKKAQHQLHHNTRQLQQALSREGARELTQVLEQRIRNTLADQQQRIQRMQSLIERLAARYRARTAAQLTVKRALHANVTLSIDGVVMTLEADRGPCRLMRAGAELTEV